MIHEIIKEDLNDAISFGHIDLVRVAYEGAHKSVVRGHSVPVFEFKGEQTSHLSLSSPELVDQWFSENFNTIPIDQI